jgi:hypothetical protein
MVSSASRSAITRFRESEPESKGVGLRSRGRRLRNTERRRDGELFRDDDRRQGIGQSRTNRLLRRKSEIRARAGNAATFAFVRLTGAARMLLPPIVVAGGVAVLMVHRLRRGDSDRSGFAVATRTDNRRSYEKDSHESGDDPAQFHPRNVAQLRGALSSNGVKTGRPAFWTQRQKQSHQTEHQRPDANPERDH